MHKNQLYILLIIVCLFTLVACGSGRDGSDTSDQTDTNATSESEVSEVTVTANPTTLPADGQSTSTIQATAVDLINDPVSEATINFTVQSGSLSSESEVTDNEGKVTVTYTAPSGVPSGATDVINATAASGEEGVYSSDTVTVNIENPTNAAGEEFGISAEYLNISGLYMAHLEDTITINLSDRFGIPVSDGTKIDFKTYNTGGYFDTQQVKTSGGTASSTLKSGGTYTQPMEGFVSVTAETQGGPNTRVNAIEIASYPDNNNIYIGTSGGGVYKSTDFGRTWKSVSRSTQNEFQGQNWMDTYIKGKNAIDADPDNSDTVYTGTGYLGRGKVYRSIDAGLTWNSNSMEEWNGIYSLNYAVMSVIHDQGSDYVWIGTEGHGALYASNGTDFIPSSSGLVHGTAVKDMVQVPGTTGNSAVLYAATKSGVYKSTNGGQNWNKNSGSTGDNITSLSLHPLSSGSATDDIIYAGTKETGVWVSTDSGTSWNAYLNGLDSWIIQDVVVDNTQNFLYTATYSRAQNASSKPSSQVYSHTINADGSMTNDDWNEASEGLVSYPTDNSTLRPIHVLKYDVNKEQLYAGGEGINFYLANSGLDQGYPQWETSNTGLSNRIMARMPILFSGICDMYTVPEDPTPDANGTLEFDVYIEDTNGNPPIVDSTFTATNVPENGDEQEIYDITYGDAYTHEGTWRTRPADNSTNIPYHISLNATNATGKIELTFTPTQQESAPGDSGLEKSFPISY